MRSLRARNWVFTIWASPNEDTIEKYARYAVWGEEICPDTKRVHWQGYIEFTEPKTMKFTVDTLCSDGSAHVEKRIGSAKQASDYCKKDGKFKTIGQMSQQGRRTDLEDLAARIQKEDMSLGGLMEDNPVLYCTYRNGLRDILAQAQKCSRKKFRNVTTQVYVGDTGTGKTRAATEHIEDTYILNTDEKLWWDGYDGEKNIVIDDFYGDIKYSTLLRILDGHQLRLPIKGGFTYAAWTNIIITSNSEPHKWYKFGMTAALKRRLPTIKYFPNDDSDNESIYEVEEDDPLIWGSSAALKVIHRDLAGDEF